MEIHAAQQGWVFAGMWLCGIGFGLLFDFFRAVRKIVPMNSLWVNLTDLVFWVVCTLSVFALTRLTNQGELRWYEFAGLFLGTGLYFLVLGSRMVTVLAAVLRAVLRLTVFVLRIACFPLRLIVRPLGLLARKTAPFRKKLAFYWSVRRQKWLFSRRQLKKILKSPKFF